MLKKIGGSAIVYAFSNGVSSAAQLLLFFLCAYILSPKDFGFLALFIVSVSLGTQLLGLGLVAAFQREFFNLDRSAIAIYLSSIICFVSIVSLIFLGLALLLATFADTLADLPSWVFVLVVVASFGQAIQQFLLILWQSEGAKAAYLKYMLLLCFLQLVIPFAFVFLMGDAWSSVAYGLSLVYLCGGFFAIIMLIRKGYLVAALDGHFLGQSLSYALPLVPHQVAGWGMAMSDRFIITSFCGAAVAGYYSLAFQVAQMINIVSSGFNQAFAPWLYSKMSSQESRDKSEIKRIVYIYGVGIVAISAIGYFMFALFVFIVPGDVYQEALRYAPWLFLAMMFNGLYRISSNFFLYGGNTVSLAMMTLVSALGSIILNYTLVPLYGAIAAGWVVCFSFFTLFFLSTLTVLSKGVLRAD